MSTDGHAGHAEWVRAALGRYEADLVRYARRITGDWERARDVVQDTFLKLCRQDPAELDGCLARWLYTVCRNRALDVRRKESRMSALAEPLAAKTVSRDPSPSEAAETNDDAGRALQLLEQLPDNQQEVLRLKFQGGLRYREIAEVTGLSVSNVGFLIHRGLKALRQKMCVENP